MKWKDRDLHALYTYYGYRLLFIILIFAIVFGIPALVDLINPQPEQPFAHDLGDKTKVYVDIVDMDLAYYTHYSAADKPEKLVFECSATGGQKVWLEVQNFDYDKFAARGESTSERLVTNSGIETRYTSLRLYAPVRVHGYIVNKSSNAVRDLKWWADEDVLVGVNSIDD